ncbi:MAG: hypothetical protein VYA54_03995 [Bdellovibrionota bacterium]|nr:hypothetical protein [Bdellovibrionota bacterium]
MKVLLMITLTLSLIACEQQELPEVTVDAEQGIGAANVKNDNASNDSTDDTAVAEPGEDSEDDHSAPTPPEQDQPTVLRAAAMVSSSSESMQLGDQRTLTVTVMTDSEFEGGNINVRIDRDELAGVDDGSYVKTDLSSSVVSGLGANSSRTILLTLETKTMSPSFSAKELKVVIEKDGLEKEYPLMLEVRPEVEVAIISAQSTPYMYNRSRATCFQEHAQGLQVIFANRTNDFAAGREPCIHTQGVLQHCNQGDPNSRMKLNEVYVVGRPGNPRKVMPSSGSVNAIYYDHFNGNDSNGKRLYFNVEPGTERTINNGGTTCE